MGHEDADEKRAKPPSVIDEACLAEKARASEHNEAYEPMGAIGDVRVGVGARVDATGEASFFMEVLFPISFGPLVDLEDLEGKLGKMKTLREEGFSISLQDDSFSCELETLGGGLVQTYERTTRLIE